MKPIFLEKKMNFNRKEKNGIRTNSLIKPMIGQKPLESILCLPGPQFLCLKEMLKNGIIDKNTYVVAVEKVDSVAKKIQKFLEANFNEYYLHRTEFYSLDLQDALEDEKLDFVYLDFCGNFGFEIKGWLNANHKYFKDSCRVCYTFKAINRKKQNENVVKRVYAKKVMNEIERKLQYTVSNLSRGVWGRSIEKDRLNVIASVNYYISDIFVAMDTQDFDVSQVILYKDGRHSEMVFIDTVLNGVKKTTQDMFNLALYSYFKQVGMGTRNKVRSALGIPSEKTKKRGRKKGTKNGVKKEKKKAITELCGIKNRKDSLTAGRKAVIKKYIKKYAKENEISFAEAKKRVWGGINMKLTIDERKVA